MTASLYQSGSSAVRRSAALVRSAVERSATGSRGRRVAHAAHARQMCAGELLRVELTKLRAPLPDDSARRSAGRAPGRPAAARARARRGRASTQPACAVRIEVHDVTTMFDRSSRSSSRRRASCVVVDRHGTAGSSRTAAPGCRGGSRFSRAMSGAGCRALEVPVPDLVLLGVEVLLAAGLARHVLEQLEGRAVDAVVRRQRRREHAAARMNAGAAAVLQVLVQDVGRIRPDVRAGSTRALGAARAR